MMSQQIIVENKVYFFFLLLFPDGATGGCPVNSANCFFSAKSVSTSGCHTLLSPDPFKLRTFSACLIKRVD